MLQWWGCLILFLVLDCVSNLKDEIIWWILLPDFCLWGCLSWLSQSGCKFTLEEERVVIELQAQFGNKWAKIASYLPGRTDNDVKNFWSSRQKRLARILQASTSTSKSQKNKAKVPAVHDVRTFEVKLKHFSTSDHFSSPILFFHQKFSIH